MNFLQATRTKLRFSTPKGTLNTEQLWDLSMADLTTTIKETKKTLSVSSNDDELSFLNEDTTPDVENTLRFSILKEIFVTKKTEAEAKKAIAETKAQNKKILELIASKQDEVLANKSIEELTAMLQ